MNVIVYYMYIVYEAQVTYQSHKKEFRQKFIEISYSIKKRRAYALRLSMILQYITAATVLTAVATIPAPTIAVGFTLPYWLR